MALNEGENMVMPVTPMGGYGNGNGWSDALSALRNAMGSMPEDQRREAQTFIERMERR